MKKLLFLISVIVSLGISAQNQTITLQRSGVVVKTYGDTSADGTVNGTALTAALTDAQTNDEILLMGKGSFHGTYAGTFAVAKNVTIKGTGGSAILKPVSSVLAANNRVMNVSSSGATFENLTITGGSVLNGVGAGANVTVGGNRFKDCLFTNNQAESTGASASWGGALCINAGLPARTYFENCQFINNAAWGNKANANQAGNDRGFGGAVACSGKISPMTFTNCVFANNYAKTYGGAVASGSGLVTEDNVQFINCTVVNNEILDSKNSPALNAASGAGMTVVNTVIYGNKGGAGQLSNGLGSKYINCAYEGAILLNTGTMTDCFSLLSNTSLFTKPTQEAGFNPSGSVAYNEADWSLVMGSYLINRGIDNSATVTTDILGNARKQVNFVDLGAYESVNKGNMTFKVSPQLAEILVGGKFPLFSAGSFPSYPSFDGAITGLPANTKTAGDYTISAAFKNSEDSQSWSSTTEDATLRIKTPDPIGGIEDETPIFIVMGQSNADASAIANASEDARLAAWYDSNDNPNLMKIWYKSTYVVNQANGGRWATEGTTVDVSDGWLDLYYKNDNLNGKTSMVMLHGNGTWSANAAARRGMEGEFGMKFQQQYPDKDLHVFKLGCSGSAIDTWVPSGDNHNWEYFFNQVYKPAISDLIAQGKKPRLTGIWWMQGESDKPFGGAYYEKKLREFITQCRTKTGFEDAPFYIGLIAQPGTNPNNPFASTHFDQGIRDAQNKLAAELPNVFTINTDDCDFDADNLHFGHVGINRIGDKVSAEVIKKDVAGWGTFKMPGKWSNLKQKGSLPVTYTPLVEIAAQPTVSYFVNSAWTAEMPTADGTYDVKVELDYGTWKESITSSLVIDSSLPDPNPTITLKRGKTVIGSYGDTALSSADNGMALFEALAEAQAADSLLLMGKQDGFAGVYERSLFIGKAIVIKGLDHTVTLKASEADRVLNMVAAEGSTFINLIITGGNLTNASGAGAYLSTGGVTFKNCIFANNQTVSDGGAAVWGGAVAVPTGQTRNYFENCQFINNAAWGNKDNTDQSGNNRGFGGAVAGMGASSPMSFTNCVFANNYAKTYGGAFASGNGNAIVDNLQFINCTVANNEILSNTNSPALHPASGAGVTAVNTVMYGNKGGSGQLVNGASSTYTNCAYEGATVGSGATVLNDCFRLNSRESLFAKPTEEAGFNPSGSVAYNEADWSLSSVSYLINRGTDNSSTLPKDILGNDRKQVGFVDLGAYEYAGKGNVGLNVLPKQATIFVGQKIPAFSAASYPSYPSFDAEVKDLPADSKTVGDYSISAAIKGNYDSQYWNVPIVTPATLTIKTPTPLSGIEDETPIFLVMGQSNADGSAMTNADEDARLKAWYDDPTQNPGQMKIWYRSTYTVGSTQGNIIADGTVQDVPDGWLDLYYKNDNLNGKTSMVGVTGTWTDHAANSRRGMEGQLGMNIQKQYPDKALHILKLGSSGSSINSWNEMGDGNSNHNWNYFFEHFYKPAINDMIYRGMKPRLMGIWWMQGESNRAESQSVYEAKLKQFITQSRDSFGFANAPVYIGRIVKPGDNPAYPLCSNQFGQGVRDAQDNMAATDSHVHIVETKDCPFNTDNVHFDHVGVNMIADKIATDVIAKGVANWDSYQTPGAWSNLDQTEGAVVAVDFKPSLGTPADQMISYEVGGQWVAELPTTVGIYQVKAVLNFQTWTDEIISTLIIKKSAGNNSIGVDNGFSIRVQNSQIVITNNGNERFTLTFINTLGQNVKQLNIVNDQTIVPTSQFASGVYVVAYDGMTNKGTTKIVIP